MTQLLLTSHQEKGACKPNQVYSLKMVIKPSKSKMKKKPESISCKSCSGKGFCVLGKTKDSRGTITMPCPMNCKPAEDEYEQFVRDCWAQLGVTDHERDQMGRRL